MLLIFFNATRADDIDDADAAYEKKDYVTALKKYKVAAAKNDPKAPYALGYMYNSGTGVEQNYVEAVRWYRSGAALGNADALYMLSIFYKLGKISVIERDDKEATRILKLASEKGSADAQNDLAFMYERGEGVAQNYAEAIQLYKLAAAQNKVDIRLGRMYKEGKGVVQDYLRAHMWWNIGASNGDEYFRKYRDEVEAKMTRQQVADAQKNGARMSSKKNEKL